MAIRSAAPGVRAPTRAHPMRAAHILAPSHQRRITVCADARPPKKGSNKIMRQARRGIAGLLAPGALAAGGSVALADNGGSHGNGNPGGNGALAPTMFTMTAADGP